MLEEYRRTPPAPPGSRTRSGPVAAPAAALAHLAACQAAWDAKRCSAPELPDTVGRYLAVRDALSLDGGPFHKCEVCNCVAELRCLFGGTCPKGEW